MKKSFLIILLSLISNSLLFADGKYIVVLKETSDINIASTNSVSSETIEEKAIRLLGLDGVSTANSSSINTNQLEKVFENVFQGFAAIIDEETLESLRNNPEVDFIEEDKVITLNSVQSPTSSWGLDRIDDRNREENQQYNYSFTGKNVNVYVIDSGVNIAHEEFTGRIGDGINTYTTDTEDLSDCNGPWYSCIRYHIRYRIWCCKRSNFTSC